MFYFTYFRQIFHRFCFERFDDIIIFVVTDDSAASKHKKISEV